MVSAAITEEWMKELVIVEVLLLKYEWRISYSRSAVTEEWMKELVIVEVLSLKNKWKN